MNKFQSIAYSSIFWATLLIRFPFDLQLFWTTSSHQVSFWVTSSHQVACWFNIILSHLFSSGLFLSHLFSSVYLLIHHYFEKPLLIKLLVDFSEIKFSLFQAQEVFHKHFCFILRKFFFRQNIL